MATLDANFPPPTFNRSKWLILAVLWYFVALSCKCVNSEPSSNDVGDLQNIISETASPPASSIDCRCPHIALDGYERDDLNRAGAKLIYLITIHNKRTAEDAVYLFRAIRSPQNIVLVHVDTKFDWNEYLNTTLHLEMEACPCGTRVHVESVHSAKWSSWSMNDPTFWGMETALSLFRGEWDVFLNLSGDTMPVYTANIMAELFDQDHGPLRGVNFVTSSACETGLLPSNVYMFPSFWHKRHHYTTNPEGNPVIQYTDENGDENEMELEIHFGSQWMALQPDFVDYVITSLKRPDSLASGFKSYLMDTKRLMTDETFIPTLLMHVYPFNETLPDVSEDGALKSFPSMRSIRFERMDEHVPTAFGYFPVQQRYDVPESSDASKPRVWGPYFLGVYDLANIKHSGALFVRKVSVAVDPNIVYMLPVSDIDDLPSIQWPHEVEIIEKPNWEKLKKELTEKAKERDKKHEQKAEKELR